MQNFSLLSWKYILEYLILILRISPVKIEVKDNNRTLTVTTFHNYTFLVFSIIELLKAMNS